jgi:hypothetical protein
MGEAATKKTDELETPKAGAMASKMVTKKKGWKVKETADEMANEIATKMSTTAKACRKADWMVKKERGNKATETVGEMVKVKAGDMADEMATKKADKMVRGMGGQKATEMVSETVKGKVDEKEDEMVTKHARGKADEIVREIKDWMLKKNADEMDDEKIVTVTGEGDKKATGKEERKVRNKVLGRTNGMTNEMLVEPKRKGE